MADKEVKLFVCVRSLGCGNQGGRTELGSVVFSGGTHVEQESERQLSLGQ